jgi:hypothetical protein
MANKKITDLSDLPSPAGADVLPIVDDVSGSPVTKKVTASNLMSLAPVQSVAGKTGAVTVDAGDLTDGNFDGTAISGFDASINEQTGTTYTLVAGDNGKVIKFTNGSAITLTLPSGLGEGFNCTVIQYGAGQITFSGTFYNQSSHTKTAGQYAVTGLISCVADAFVLAGDTAS